MAISKKHYATIARIIRDSETKLRLIDRLVSFFGEDNSNFDPYRFRLACGYELEKEKLLKGG